MSKTGQHTETTLDGRRTEVRDLGIEQSDATEALETPSREAGLRARLARLYRNLNLIVAGMYTGLGCYGTPHSHRPARQSGDAETRRSDGDGGDGDSRDC